MKITDLIDMLNAALNEHGDIEVEVEGDRGVSESLSGKYEVLDVYKGATEGGNAKVLVLS